jgi:hypothetical protein
MCAGLNSLEQKLPRRLFEAYAAEHVRQSIAAKSSMLATICDAGAVQFGLHRHGFLPAYAAPNVRALRHSTETYKAALGLRSDDTFSSY